MSALAVVTGLGAALLLAVGFVLQQRAASDEPPELALSPRLLVHLVRRPLWLAGIGAMVLGQLLGATALDLGSLALVEPLLAANLLFALPLSAAWHRRRLGVREWAGALMLSGGLGGFVAVAQPHGGNVAHLPWPNWAIAGGGFVLVAGALVAAVRGRRLGEEATLLAAAAGVLYGLQDALTRRLLAGQFPGLPELLTSWPPYALVGVAIVGLLLAQSAFEAAPLAASLPAITMAEPIAGIAFGVGVYGESIRLAPGYLAAEVLTIGAMVAGVILVARSPLVTGTFPGEAGREEELGDRQAA